MPYHCKTDLVFKMGQEAPGRAGDASLMLFNSSIFILAFLPVTLAVFFAVGRYSANAAAALLGIASLIFYGAWNAQYVPLLLGSIGVNFALSQVLGDGQRSLGVRRAVFVAAVTANLALLGYFKYANFFLATFSSVANAQLSLGAIVLPLGISFYTFTQIAFLADTWKNHARERNFAHYLLFVTYFPHLIAGPILHHGEMMPQFRKKAIYTPDWGNLAAGVSVFILGLAKKALIADAIAPVARAVFTTADAGVQIEFLRAWGGAMAYAMQIYFDFSGYCDMAIGISILFGVRMPLNFNSPYKASSITDFWRRWHMTLSRFLRDYLYIPLGGSRRTRPRRYLNLMITMLLGGLWHGAAWTYVAWGGLHGFYLVVNHAWKFLWKRAGRKDTPAGLLVLAASVAVTFSTVVVAWVLFRATSFASALRILGGMAGLHGIDLPAKAGLVKALATKFGMAPQSQAPYISNTAILGLMILLAICWLTPNVYQVMGLRNPSLTAIKPAASVVWRPSLGWAICLGILGAVAFTGILSGPPSEFLYFQF
jgi:alginate O-acetyltransferase complex protein AlgI